MLKRALALVLIILAPGSVALGLPDGTAVQTAPYTITVALDQAIQTVAPGKPNKDPTVAGYALNFHDSQYQYTIAICSDATLLDVDGRGLDPSTLVPGDTLVISVRSNTSTTAKTCISRVVRQAISPGPSGGECLQHFQVKRSIANNPTSLQINTEYTYQLTIYNRPTLDCDGQAYGGRPFTTTIAAGKVFTITLQRGNTTLTQWAVTTDTNGRANISYTFTRPSNDYQFQLVSNDSSTTGDVISWGAQVIDPHPQPSASPTPTNTSPELPPAPLFILSIVILAAASAAEYWHWTHKKRSHELPEKEYERTPKL